MMAGTNASPGVPRTCRSQVVDDLTTVTGHVGCPGKIFVPSHAELYDYDSDEEQLTLGAPDYL